MEHDWAEDWQKRLQATGYLSESGLATTLGLAIAMERPLLLEGPAGSGKTQLAYRLAETLGRDLIRLQCYEGIDAHAAIYDWNYHRQLAALARSQDDTNPFAPEFLLERPLLEALTRPRGAVLLIDEVDRADEAFDALLLEFLAEFQVSIPEYGTVHAQVRPHVVLTSNRTRPLADALRRRCLYYFLDWPERDREVAIIAHTHPDLAEPLRETLVDAVRCLRQWDLMKPPGVAETIDWAQAAVLMGLAEWQLDWIAASLGCVVKDEVDLETVRARLTELLNPAG